jgi:soluble P-type ATPase
MIRMDIKGFGKADISHIVLDYNGTLALDGKVMPGVLERLEELAMNANVHVITADTFGIVRSELKGANASVRVLSGGDEGLEKLDFLEGLGPDGCIAIGNGRNDELMVEGARIGMCIMGREGCSPRTLASSDAVFQDIIDALDAILNEKRLVATLRR